MIHRETVDTKTTLRYHVDTNYQYLEKPSTPQQHLDTMLILIIPQQHLDTMLIPITPQEH